MPVSQQAQALAVRLFAAYPGRSVGQMHLLSAAEALDEVSDVAVEVVDVLRHDKADPPAVADIVSAAREGRATRLELEREAGPAPLTDEEWREMWKEVKARWGKHQHSLEAEDSLEAEG